MSDLPDVSANFRSMMYMGITSTNQTSIQSTTGARSVDRSVTHYLIASPRIKPIPSPFFFSSSSFWLWFAILGAHIHSNTHTRAFASAAEYYTVTTSAHRGSMHSNEPSGSGANVPLVKCVAAQRDGGEASRSCLYADTLPLPSGRRLKVTMIAALGGPERSFRCAAEEVQYSKRGATSCSFQRKARDGDNSEVRF